MVVTRKVRKPKEDSATASTSNEAENVVEAEQILPEDEIEESEAEIATETEQEIDVKNEENEENMEKRVSKPTFKVKMATKNLAGNFFSMKM